MGPCVSSPAGRGGATHIPAREGEGTGQSVSLPGDRTPQAQPEATLVPPGDRIPAVLWGIGASGPGRNLEGSLVPVCRLSMECAHVWDTLGSKLGTCSPSEIPGLTGVCGKVVWGKPPSVSHQYWEETEISCDSQGP